MYDHAIYDTRTNAPSYWEATAGHLRAPETPLEADERCDVAIIGGGYTGLSAALHLARDHGIEARVLEAGPIAWGASGRNGGLCVTGATKLSLQQMLRRHGRAATQAYHHDQVAGIALVRQLCADEGIDCDLCGEGHFSVAHKPSRMRELRAEAQALETLFGIRTALYTAEEFAAVGHGGTEQFGALWSEHGCALHPLKFALGLAGAARRHGAHLHGYSRVLDWRREGREHVLQTARGSLRARRVIVATNGYYRDGLSAALDHRCLPVISNIITTRALTDAEIAAQPFHTHAPMSNTRHLLFYYRLLPDRSFLFGARGDVRGTPEAGARMRAWLEWRFREVFPAWRDVEITHFWRGLIALTRDRVPAAGALENDPSVWFGFGYHGNGVNTAPLTGQRLARLVAGVDAPRDVLPRVMHGLPARLPASALRPWLLRGTYLALGLRDRL